MTNPTMSEAEIKQITGYKRPGDQLAELRRQGFHRARRSRTTGHVILEREHYQAVCAGARSRERLSAEAPRVHVPQLRAV
jgi:hypothetical protein